MMVTKQIVSAGLFELALSIMNIRLRLTARDVCGKQDSALCNGAWIEAWASCGQVLESVHRACPHMMRES